MQSSRTSLAIELGFFHIIWRYAYTFKGSFVGTCRSPCFYCTAVKLLAYKKLPLCHIKIQFKAPDTTLIKSSWKQMLVYWALQLAKLRLCWTIIRGSVDSASNELPGKISGCQQHTFWSWKTWEEPRVFYKLIAEKLPHVSRPSSEISPGIHSHCHVQDIQISS